MVLDVRHGQRAKRRTAIVEDRKADVDRACNLRN
jgi:hypothetical protein